MILKRYHRIGLGLVCFLLAFVATWKATTYVYTSREAKALNEVSKAAAREIARKEMEIVRINLTCDLAAEEILFETSPRAQQRERVLLTVFSSHHEANRFRQLEVGDKVTLDYTEKDLDPSHCASVIPAKYLSLEGVVK